MASSETQRIHKSQASTVGRSARQTIVNGFPSLSDDSLGFFQCLQVVDFGDMGPVRCSQPSCRAYINPFFKFFDAGRRFYCNMCGAETNTPDAYVDVAQNRRLEGMQRPELSHGTVEFCADLPQFQVTQLPGFAEWCYRRSLQ